jgi:hypothetical protein
MKSIAVTVVFLVGSAVLPLCSAYASPMTGSPDAVMVQTDLSQQMKQAHSASDYRALAVHFSEQEQVYRTKAAEEKAEWERRQQITVSIAEKYPQPVDSARYLYDYYSQKADRMSKTAAEYEARAAAQTH